MRIEIGEDINGDRKIKIHERGEVHAEFTLEDGEDVRIEFSSKIGIEDEQEYDVYSDMVLTSHPTFEGYTIHRYERH